MHKSEVKQGRPRVQGVDFCLHLARAGGVQVRRPLVEGVDHADAVAAPIPQKGGPITKLVDQPAHLGAVEEVRETAAVGVLDRLDALRVIRQRGVRQACAVAIAVGIRLELVQQPGRGRADIDGVDRAGDIARRIVPGMTKGNGACFGSWRRTCPVTSIELPGTGRNAGEQEP